MTFWLLYITNPNRATAVKVGKRLISKRIAACVNVLSIADSVYRWKGKIENVREWALIVKTTKPMKAEGEVRKIHPYTVPCIIRWKVAANADYERWLRAQVKQP